MNGVVRITPGPHERWWILTDWLTRTSSRGTFCRHTPSAHTPGDFSHVPEAWTAEQTCGHTASTQRLASLPLHGQRPCVANTRMQRNACRKSSREYGGCLLMHYRREHFHCSTWQCLSLIPLCLETCSSMDAFRVNALPQMSHGNGFWPAWTRRWTWSCSGFWKTFSQMPQLSLSSSISLAEESLLLLGRPSPLRPGEETALDLGWSFFLWKVYNTTFNTAASWLLVSTLTTHHLVLF